jgi:hypothetical protein
MTIDQAIEEAERLFLRARPSTVEEERARVLSNMARLRALRLAKEEAEGPPKKRHRI